MKKKCQEKKAECVYEMYHGKGSKAGVFSCCLTNASGYSLRGTRTASTLPHCASADKELKMRHKATENHAFSVRTVTDDKNHVLWHIQNQKPSTLQFPHQKDCGCFSRFKSDLCFLTWLFVFCLITAFMVYQIFLSRDFRGCQQLGSSASSQTMPEFRSEPGIPASRLGKRGTVTEVIPVHQALEDSHPLSLLQPLPSSPAANSVCSWAHCKPSVGRVKADREVHNGKPRIMVQLKTEQCPSCIPGSYCCSFLR